MEAMTIGYVRPNAWRDFWESVVVALVLTVFSYFVAIQFGWVTEVNNLEAFAVLTSYSCTWLCVRQRRLNYFIGVLSTIAYAVLFYQADLIASMVLNIYLTPTLLYGWFRWNRDVDTRPVQHVRWSMVPVYLAVSVGFYGGALAIVKAFGGEMAMFDSAILIGTILAQFLLDNKKLENWIIWAIVNVLAIYVYAKAGLQLAAFQYVFFLFNVFVGYYQWKKSMNKEIANV